MIRTRTVALFGIFVLLIGAALVSIATRAEAADCKASTVIGIGGVNDPNSGVYNGKADVIVKHSGRFGDIEGGITAFDTAVKGVRAACADTQIIASGFSQGAAVVHTWLQRNAAVANKVGVLFSDPKQAGSGSLFWQRDANFGGTTTVSVCRKTDVICNLSLRNARGYPREHLAYDFDARKYAGKTGVLWQ